MPFANAATRASWVVTKHQTSIGGKTIAYTATCGFIPIRGETETEGLMFFMAYTMDHPPAGRPLLFSFNGGPGSASVWLHMGAIGPKRVAMEPEGWMPPPPYRGLDNAESWLDKADLCFIDPIGTGYSRATKPEYGKKFWSQRGDIDSIGEFVRMYLTLEKRWTSPLFVAGESYGTFRAAGLADNLLSRGIALNGIIMVSTTLNFAAIDAFPANDLPYISYLPTFTATAWYHKKLDPDLQGKNLEAILPEVEGFASGEYASALLKGDALSDADRDRLAARLARYTGLRKEWILLTDLRINDEQFRKELMRRDKWTLGRLDSRFKGMDRSGVGEGTDYDPSMSAIGPPYTSVFADYVRRELGFESDQVYFILGGGIQGWSFPEGSPAQTGSALRTAMTENPFLKVLVCSGYYDMATPYLGAKLNFAHLGLDSRLKSHVDWTFYPAGHMMYIDDASRVKLKADIAKFIDTSIPRR